MRRDRQMVRMTTKLGLQSNVREAVHCHFDEGKAPPVIRLHTVKDEVISA